MAKSKQQLVKEAKSMGVKKPEEIDYQVLRGVVAKKNDAKYSLTLKTGGKKHKAKKNDAKYSLTLKTGGKKHKAKTNDIAKAILDFGIEYTNTETYVQVSKGKKTAEWRCNVPFSRRLFRNPLTAEAVANRLKLQLNE